MAQHDQVIEDGTGVVVRADINAALAALFSSSSGDTEPEVKKAGQLWFDTGVDPATLRLRNEANTGWIVFTTGLDAAGLQSALSSKAPKTANGRNHIINPTCQVSQDNGNTASATAAAQIPAFYPADQWGVLWNLTGGTANAQRKAGADGGSEYVSFNVVTPVAAPGGGDRAEITQDLEGLMVKDLNWFSSSGAKNAVLRFRFIAPTVGTYTAFVRGSTHTYFVNFDVTTPNVWKAYSFTVPAPPVATAASWVNTNAKCMTVGVGITAGAGFKATGLGWQQPGNTCPQTIGATNGASAAGTFGLTDVGLYADPDQTGIAPAFEAPNYEDDLAACMRYLQKPGPQLVFTSYAAAGGQVVNGWYLPFPMRTTPTVTYGSPSYGNASAVTTNSVTANWLSTQCLATAAGSAYSGFSATINARM